MGRTDVGRSTLPVAMTRYFFHSQTDTRYTDVEGMTFEMPSEARKQAIILAGAMLADAPEPFWGSRPWSVTVTDETRLILWEIMIDGITAPAAGLKSEQSSQRS